jgi:hypothetical protein
VTLIPGSLALSLELVTASTEFSDSLLRQQLLERPFLDILLLVLFELCDELDGALQNRAFVLFTPRNNLCQLVDAFVDGFASAAFNYVKLVTVNISWDLGMPTFFVIVSPDLVPLL